MAHICLGAEQARDVLIKRTVFTSELPIDAGT